MPAEVEIERLVTRLVGDGSSYQKMLKDAQQATANYERTQQRAAEVTKSVQTASERYAEKLAELNSLLKSGAISQETYARATHQVESSMTGAAEAQRRAAAVTRSVETEGERHMRQLQELGGLLSQGAISQETYNRSLAQLRNGLTSTQAAQRELAQQSAHAQAVISALKTPTERYNEQLAQLKGHLAAGRISQEQYARALGMIRGELPDVRAQQAALNQKIQEAQRITASTRTPTEKYASELANLDTLLSEGRISQDTYNRAVSQLRNTLPEVQKAQQKANAEVQEAARLTDSLRTPYEQHREKLAQLNTHLASGRISQETYNRGLRNLRNEIPAVQATQARLNHDMQIARALMDATKPPLMAYRENMQRLNRLLADGHITQQSYGRAVKQATQEYKFAADNLDRFAGSLRSTGMAMTVTGGILTAALTGMGLKALRSAGQFEQTTIAFETMMGSVSQTTKLMADLTEFAALTPFEMPEILQATRGLVQFGERGQQLMDTLNMLGNASAGTSTQFGLLALIFNQVRGVGKLLTQDFRQMSTRGVISLQDIANHFSKVTKQVVSLEQAQKMLSSGQVSFEDLRAILKGLSSEGGRFFNLMQRQSESLLGLWSTLTDEIGIMYREFGTVLVPIAKELLKSVMGIVGALRTLSPQHKRMILDVAMVVFALGTFITAAGTTIIIVGQVVIAYNALRKSIIALRVAELATGWLSGLSAAFRGTEIAAKGAAAANATFTASQMAAGAAQASAAPGMLAFGANAKLAAQAASQAAAKTGFWARWFPAFTAAGISAIGMIKNFSLAGLGAKATSLAAAGATGLWRAGVTLLTGALGKLAAGLGVAYGAFKFGEWLNTLFTLDVALGEFIEKLTGIDLPPFVDKLLNWQLGMKNVNDAAKESIVLHNELSQIHYQRQEQELKKFGVEIESVENGVIQLKDSLLDIGKTNFGSSTERLMAVERALEKAKIEAAGYDEQMKRANARVEQHSTFLANWFGPGHQELKLAQQGLADTQHMSEMAAQRVANLQQIFDNLNTSGAVDSFAELKQGLEESVTALQAQIDAFGMTESAARIHQAEMSLQAALAAGRTEEEVQGIRDLIAEYKQLDKQLTEMQGRKKVIDSIDQFTQSLHDQFATLGMSSGAAQLYAMEQEAIRNGVVDMADSFAMARDQLQQFEEAKKQFEDAERVKKGIEAIGTEVNTLVGRLMDESRVLDMQTRAFGDAGIEVEIYALRMKSLREGYGDLTQAQMDSIRAAAKVADAAREQNQLMEKGKQLTEQFRSPMEKFKQAQQELDRMLQAGFINIDTYNAAMQDASKTLHDASKQAEKPVTAKFEVEGASLDLKTKAASFLAELDKARRKARQPIKAPPMQPPPVPKPQNIPAPNIAAPQMPQVQVPVADTGEASKTVQKIQQQMANATGAGQRQSLARALAHQQRLALLQRQAQGRRGPNAPKPPETPKPPRIIARATSAVEAAQSRIKRLEGVDQTNLSPEQKKALESQINSARNAFHQAQERLKSSNITTQTVQRDRGRAQESSAERLAKQQAARAASRSRALEMARGVKPPKPEALQVNLPRMEAPRVQLAEVESQRVPSTRTEKHIEVRSQQPEGVQVKEHAREARRDLVQEKLLSGISRDIRRLVEATEEQLDRPGRRRRVVIEASNIG